MTPAQEKALAVALDGLRESGVAPADVVRALYDEATAARMQLACSPVDFDPAAVLAAPPNDDADGAEIRAGRRCAIFHHSTDWWVGISPRNGHGSAVEGPWEDWVRLARGILAVEAVRLSPAETPAIQTAHTQHVEGES